MPECVVDDEEDRAGPMRQAAWTDFILVLLDEAGNHGEQQTPCQPTKDGFSPDETLCPSCMYLQAGSPNGRRN
jgi:hypothetical protein